MPPEQPDAGTGAGAWGEVHRLRAELTGLHQAMSTRATIEQAKGILSERLSIDPESAFDYLVRLSQQANVRLADVAAKVARAQQRRANVTRDRHDLLSRVETLGALSWVEWDRQGVPLRWSPESVHLLGAASGRPAAPSLAQLLARVVVAERPAIEALVRRVFDGHLAVTEVRVRLDDGRARTVRVAAGPGPDQAQPTLFALLHDVTAAGCRQSEFDRISEQLALLRMDLGSQRALVEDVRRLLYPPSDHCVEGRGLTLRVRHLASASMHRFRGDFYDVVGTGSATVLILGDVFGCGVAAAAAMVRLRHAARALALAGVDPARLLALLNHDLTRDPEPPLASMMVAAFTPPTATVTWAQAGHLPPVLLRQGRGRTLRRPAGVAIGLTAQAQYAAAVTSLRPGDTLVGYTDGVLSGLDPFGDPHRELVRQLGQAHRCGGSPALLDRFVRPGADEACLAVAEFTGVPEPVPELIGSATPVV
ncbi:MAG TPA: SpoIIE family protein phosphatase [Micromonosporaceae bacterium]